jgi:hypothetical protein
MASIPLKAQYGPTLGGLLAPRWRATARWVRGLVIVAGVSFVAFAVGLALTLERASIHYGGAVPFSFEYRGLYRVAPGPGEYVKVAHYKDGSLEYSFAVAPLELPPYQGSLSGELPLFASAYIKSVAKQYAGFQFEGEGKTRVNTVPGYSIFYIARVQGREMYGRNVLLLPERPGARKGVEIVMLTSPNASSQVKSPTEVAGAGPVSTALHTFSFE